MCAKVDIKRIEVTAVSGEVLSMESSELVMETMRFDIFSRAMDIILGNKKQRETMLEGELISAKVFLDRMCSVRVTKNSFVVLDEAGENYTERYFDLVEESEEEFYIRHFEEYKKETYPHKLKYYRTYEDEELEEFADKTDGVGVTRGFRSHMTNFIRNFKPELLVKGKPYILILNKKGEFCVEDIYNPGERALLSENEETIYHYLCYLHLSNFWSQIKCIKDQNHLAPPLIVDDFLDRLDQSTDTKQLIDKAVSLNRQAFFSKRTCEQ